MPKVICDVCQEALDLSKFLFLPCGHGFCTDCTPQLFPSLKKAESPLQPESTSTSSPRPAALQNTPARPPSLISLYFGSPRPLTLTSPAPYDRSKRAEKCPICRVPMTGPKDSEPKPHPVYVHLEEESTPEDKVDAVKRWMELVGNGVVPPATKSGKTLSERVEEVMKDSEVDETLVTRLLESSLRIEDKISSSFFETRQQQDEKAFIHDRLLELVDKYNDYVSQRAEEMSSSKNQLSALIKENSNQLRQLNSGRKIVAEQDKEIEKLKAMIEEKNNEIAALKARLDAPTTMSACGNGYPSIGVPKQGLWAPA